MQTTSMFLEKKLNGHSHVVTRRQALLFLKKKFFFNFPNIRYKYKIKKNNKTKIANKT